mgnify:CR=1 FL=1
MMPILSNFQNGLRNAKVYKTTAGEYGVIVYDANDDFNYFQSFDTEDEAENFAEDRVNGNLSV